MVGEQTLLERVFADLDHLNFLDDIFETKKWHCWIRFCTTQISHQNMCPRKWQKVKILGSEIIITGKIRSSNIYLCVGQNVLILTTFYVMFAHISHKMSSISFANKIDRIAFKLKLIEIFLEKNNWRWWGKLILK